MPPFVCAGEYPSFPSNKGYSTKEKLVDRWLVSQPAQKDTWQFHPMTQSFLHLM